MANIYGPNLVTDGLVFCVDAANKYSYAEAGVIPPKSESIAPAWEDYESGSSHWTALGDDGVILHNTSNSWVGRFRSQISSTGYWTVSYEYQATNNCEWVTTVGGGTFVGTTVTATTTKQIYTQTQNWTSTGETRFYIRRNSNDGGVLTITNFRLYKTDSSGNSLVWHDLGGSYNTTLTNGPTFSSTNGGSIVFDGTDDRAVGGDVYSSSAMTISAWVNLDVVPASQPQSYNCILSKRDGGITQRSYFLAWQKSSSKLYWELKNSSGTYFIQYSTKTNWSASQWYNIVATYTASTGVAKMYVDGVEDAGTFSPSQPWSLDPIPDTTANTVVGGTHGGHYEIDGKIASVLFYSKSLTATEILQNFEAHKERFGL